MNDDDTAPTPADDSLTHVLGNLTSEGADGQFRAIPGGGIQCLTCRQDFPAATVDAVETTRLEGASDPAEMTMTIPVQCPHCGMSGALTLAYGPHADEAETDALLAFPRTPRPDRDGSGLW